MTVAMTAAGMARHIFRQSIYPKERNVFGNCSFLRLKYPHTGSVQLVQRSAANASNNYCIHLMTAKPRYRIAGPMLMDLVAVVDLRDRVAVQIALVPGDFYLGRFPGRDCHGGIADLQPSTQAGTHNRTCPKLGDRVVYASVQGAYAEYAIAPAWRLVPVPEGVSAQQAVAVMIQGMTAHYLTHSTYPLNEGEIALVHAAGGGTGHAIAWQCALENCERLVLVNRTLAKTSAIVERLRPFFAEPRVLGPVARLEAVRWHEAAVRAQLADIDRIVNATPLGMNTSDPAPIPARLLLPHHIVFDCVYRPSRTALLRAADEAGARGANGLSMLLYQGALSFSLWFNREAPIEAMRAALAS